MVMVPEYLLGYENQSHGAPTRYHVFSMKFVAKNQIRDVLDSWCEAFGKVCCATAVSLYVKAFLPSKQ